MFWEHIPLSIYLHILYLLHKTISIKLLYLDNLFTYFYMLLHINLYLNFGPMFCGFNIYCIGCILLFLINMFLMFFDH